MSIPDLVKDVKGPYSLAAFLAFILIKALVHTNVINNPRSQKTIGNLAYIALGSAALLLIFDAVKAPSGPSVSIITSGPGSPVTTNNTGQIEQHIEFHEVAASSAKASVPAGANSIGK